MSYIFEILPSFKCMYKCEYCINKPSNFGYTDELEMNLDDIELIYKNLDKLDEYKIVITGGEPLLYKYINELIERNIKNNKVKSIRFLTNFALCDKIFNNIDLYTNNKIFYTISCHTEFINNIDEYIDNILRLQRLMPDKNVHILPLITNNININDRMIQNLDKLILKIKKIKIKPVNFLDQKYVVRYRNYLTRFDDELKTNKRICEFKNTFKGKICKPNHLLCIFPTGVPRNCNGLMNDINFITNNYSKEELFAILDKEVVCTRSSCWCPDYQIIEKR